MTTLTSPQSLALSTAPADERPRRRRVQRGAADGLTILIWASAAAAVALYLSRGTVDLSGPAAALTAGGIVAGLIASDLVLVMLVLAARIPLIDRVVGHDRAMVAHRRIGKPAFYLLLAHAVLLTLGYGLADSSSIVSETIQLFSTPDMPLAYLSLGLFAIVIATSLVVARRRLPYEAWHVIHLLSYAAVLTALPHQLSLGGVLADGSAQRWYWVALYAAAVGSIVVFRMVRPVVQSLRHRLSVDSVERIAPDAFSIHLTGRRLEELRARGGQYFFWRFLSRRTWWHAHPFSLSAAPTARGLRITVRTTGPGALALADLRPGTPVMFSGPFGLFTDRARAHRRVALIAAGIGVTPIRALVERQALDQGAATILVRASDAAELYLFEELSEWANANGHRLYASVGPRATGSDAWLSRTDATRGVTLRSAFPDLANSDVYVCGPSGWADAVTGALHRAGVASADIHRERFDW